TFPTSDWHALWLFEGCAPFTSTIAYHTSTSGDSRSLPEIDLVGGTTYYVVVATWENSPQSTEYTLTITENTCTNATATYSVVSDCDVSGGFLVDVEITDMGTATDLTISDDQGSTPQAITATGTYQFGPYDNGTDVVFTITDDNDANCVQTSSTITQAACPPDNIKIGRASCRERVWNDGDAEARDGIRGFHVTGVQTCALPISTDLTISDDQGSTPQAITATGTYQFGPYDNGTDVVFTITDDNDANCVQTSSTITQAACPPDNI